MEQEQDDGNDGEGSSIEDGENSSTGDGEDSSTRDGEDSSTGDGEDSSTEDGDGKKKIKFQVDADPLNCTREIGNVLSIIINLEAHYNEICEQALTFSLGSKTLITKKR